jgi:hypothetical protein
MRGDEEVDGEVNEQPFNVQPPSETVGQRFMSDEESDDFEPLTADEGLGAIVSDTTRFDDKVVYRLRGQDSSQDPGFAVGDRVKVDIAGQKHEAFVLSAGMGVEVELRDASRGSGTVHFVPAGSVSPIAG